MGLESRLEPVNSSPRADKCGEVAGLRVERAKGIQDRPPLMHLTRKTKLIS